MGWNLFRERTSRKDCKLNILTIPASKAPRECVRRVGSTLNLPIRLPDPFLPKSPLSVRWTGKLKPTVSGRYTFSFTSDDGCRLSIDNQMLIDAWQAHAVSTDSASIYLEAGKEYQLKAEYYDNRDYAIVKLQWKVPQIGKGNSSRFVRRSRKSGSRM